MIKRTRSEQKPKYRNIDIYLDSKTLPQRIWANGDQNGVISRWQWGVFNHEKGTIWQFHLAAQKEGVVTTIIFSNHKTY